MKGINCNQKLKQDVQIIEHGHPTFSAYICSLIDREYEVMKSKRKKPVKNQYTYPMPQASRSIVYVTRIHDEKLQKLAAASHRTKEGYINWLLAVEVNRNRQKPVVKHKLKDETDQ